MSLTPIPPSPRESAPLMKIFCLTGHKINGPLPTGLKFKKQIVKTSKNVVEMLFHNPQNNNNLFPRYTCIL